MEAIGERGALDLSRETTVSDVSSGMTFVADGDVLLAKVTPCFENGKGAIAAGLKNGFAFATTEVYALRPTDCVEARFLDYLLRSETFRQYGTARLLGAGGLKRLSATDLRNFEFELPSSQQQRAIADFLDRETAGIDTLIEEQQRLVDLLRERRHAAVESSVADASSTTSGQRLKHVVSAVQQGWSPQCYPWPADGVEKWAVLKAGAANGGVFRSTENKELPDSAIPRPETVVTRGQLIVSRANTRELAGSAAVVDGDFPRLMLSDKLYGFSLDSTAADPAYVAAVLGTKRWRGLIELEATGSSPSMQNISQADILNLPMDLPSLAEQRRIVAYLDEQTSKIDNLIAESERFIELARERRAAVVTCAVTGKIDVRDEVMS
ncbi:MULTISPECIES: restriction endonuclease subunit S [Tsukamurella]|uniref:Restriction endonuclease subunit S n=2 Tax=Tsukamurella TaxID=2060 RepID=A0A5C5S2H7_9ACTN|nr:MULTISPECIES: restriction endonuclease subunit S [Tsukamurella]NMD54394.1 restriction endonuclease subunit S [Tsukamurella columbiensis]TWS28920.1 restriction endonuclease subunit S [Tsukamurella conjunctivitidis]